MPTLLTKKTVRARKTHICAICDVPAAQPGEEYVRRTYVHDGRLYDWINCSLCDVLVNAVYYWVHYPDEGVGKDEFYEWAHAHIYSPQWGDQARAYLTRRFGEDYLT